MLLDKFDVFLLFVCHDDKRRKCLERDSVLHYGLLEPELRALRMCIGGE